jgi:lipopolysaccharide transport system permease protein
MRAQATMQRAVYCAAMIADRFPATPQSMLRGLVAQRELIGELARRDVIGRYRGSALGLSWSLFHPLLLLGVFTFVFGSVMPARWSALGADASHADFALILFPGMIVHALLAECLNRAPGLVTATPNYVKKVVFPLEVLPVVTLAGALFHAVVSFAMLLAVYAIVHGGLRASAIALPLVIAPYALLVLGFAWFFAALGVYLRDVGQVMGVATMALMFLAPVFYPVTAIPEAYRGLLYLNPITLIVEETRGVLIFGRWPDWPALGVYTLIALAVAWAGYWWFQKSRKGFADVL